MMNNMGTAIVDEVTNYTDQDFERMAQGSVLPKDRYPLRIGDVKDVVSREKGTDGIELKIEVADGPYRNEMFTDTIWLTDGSKRRTHFLQAKFGILIKG